MAAAPITIVLMNIIMGSGRIMISKEMDSFHLEEDLTMASGPGTKLQEEGI